MIAPTALATIEGETLAAYVRQRWGGPVTLVPVQTVAIGIAATRVAKNNPRRMEMVIVNSGLAAFTIDFSSAVAVGAGFVCNPLGGGFIFSADEDGELVGYDLWGIAAVVGNNALLYEVQRV